MFPKLRIRITPPKGLVYAPSNTKDRDLSVLLQPYDIKDAFLSKFNCILNPDSAWVNWQPTDKDFRTNPAMIYTQEANKTSLGFLDDPLIN